MKLNVFGNQKADNHQMIMKEENTNDMTMTMMTRICENGTKPVNLICLA